MLGTNLVEFGFFLSYKISPKVGGATPITMHLLRAAFTLRFSLRFSDLLRAITTENENKFFWQRIAAVA